jgi:gliding motility-associated-like protein
VVGGLEYFPNALVVVMNRWGQKVFESTGYTLRWDGTSNGLDLPVADYYYIIDLSDGQDAITGTVTLKY